MIQSAMVMFEKSTRASFSILGSISHCLHGNPLSVARQPDKTDF
jgi:hypothetical protein